MPERSKRRRYHTLTDDWIERLFRARAEFADTESGPVATTTVWDRTVRGLALRIGIRTITWEFTREYRDHGRRGGVYKTLGHWPKITTTEARKAAEVVIGEMAGGQRDEGKRSAITFGDAFTQYVAYLEARAARAGKPPRWARTVQSLGRTLILPRWQNWTLREMSDDPDAVAAWHVEISKGRPISGNRSASIVRAVYLRAKRRNRKLPPEVPTSGVEMNAAAPAQTGMPFDQYPAWLAALRKIDNRVHVAYHLFLLFTGARPGEAAALQWGALDLRKRVVTIANPKGGKEAPITIPMSAAIAGALRMARDAAVSNGGSGAIFPACGQVGARAALPYRGNALRHSYRNVALDLGLDPVTSHILMGHSLKGVNQRYLTRFVLTGGQGLRMAQRRISKRIVELLGL